MCSKVPANTSCQKKKKNQQKITFPHLAALTQKTVTTLCGKGPVILLRKDILFRKILKLNALPAVASSSFSSFHAQRHGMWLPVCQVSEMSHYTNHHYEECKWKVSHAMKI